MSTIIAFHRDASRRRAEQPRPPERTRTVCEIVIFPGVRYERHEPSPERPRPRGKRDRLEID